MVSSCTFIYKSTYVNNYKLNSPRKFAKHQHHIYDILITNFANIIYCSIYSSSKKSRKFLLIRNTKVV